MIVDFIVNFKMRIDRGDLVGLGKCKFIFVVFKDRYLYFFKELYLEVN